MKVKSISRVRPFETLWTVPHQASPSMGFSRQEYQSGLPFPSPEDLPNPGIEPRSPALQADALPSEPPGKLLQGGWYLHSGFESIQTRKSTLPHPPHPCWVRLHPIKCLLTIAMWIHSCLS